MQRIGALRSLHEAGLKTWVSMEPYPTPNIVTQDIREILKAVSFVDRIVFGRWNYSNRCTSFPHSPEFYNAMAEHVARSCDRHGIDFHIKEGTKSEHVFAS